ncbi:MAG: glycosyltransferase, partial [Flavobacterium sp.]
MKRVLYFYPDNPVAKNSGNRTWAMRLLKYFKNRGVSVDFVSLSDWAHDWDTASVDWLLDNKLATNVHILFRKPPKKNIANYLISYKLPFLLKNRDGVLPDLVGNRLKHQFNAILKQRQYDYIIISYAHWAHLLKNNPLVGKAKTIIDTHDFLTSLFQNHKRFKLGASFEEEIKRLRLFNEIWTTSTDEQYIFSQFCKGSDVRLITTNLDRNHLQEKPISQRQYDIIYVASDNPHNKRSIKWFFDQVYPLLPQNLRICIIGRITAFVNDYPNVVKVPFVQDLSEYYTDTKIVICPMLSGTGIKIKVVEAFSYALPVVGTTRALDGLANKTHNGCLISDDPETFAKYIKLLLSDERKYK